MNKRRVSIRYKPRLYADLLDKIFRSYRGVLLIENGQAEAHSGPDSTECVDVVILSIGRQEELEQELYPAPPAQAKIVAFPVQGNIGYRRMPGKKYWEKIVPFGMRQLLDEVLTQ